MNDNKIHRHSFVVIDNKVIFQRDGDYRTTKDWLRADNLLTPEMDYDDLLRGTYDVGGIHFFKGDHFRTVPPCALPRTVIHEVYAEWVKRYDYHYCDLPIWTGMEMSDVGTLWRPRRLVGVYRAEGIIEFIGGRD